MKGKNQKQWNIVEKISILDSHEIFIEDVYGTGTSFNVFSRSLATQQAQFYKSAYTLEAALNHMEHLGNTLINRLLEKSPLE